VTKSKERKKVFRSMEEFEETYFPNAYKKKKTEELEDYHDLGINWAKEYLEKSHLTES